ncbi:MAG: glucokinase, partial [Pseudomonadota bacterium]
LERFLDAARAALGGVRIERACLGAAGPVQAGRVRLTNRPWVLDARELEAALGVVPLLLNDFEAAAHGIDLLEPAELLVLQPGAARDGAAQLVIGAGTGLGVAFRVRCGEGYRVVAGEAGHAGFAPGSPEQLALAQWLAARRGRVSAESVVSGPGLARIHAFLRAANDPGEAAEEDPAAICARGLEGTDRVAARALSLFLECYGSVAGDHALAVNAAGGVYLAGGILRRIVPRRSAAELVAAFGAKGDHARVARGFPVYAVTTDRLGLLGAAHAA